MIRREEIIGDLGGMVVFEGFPGLAVIYAISALTDESTVYGKPKGKSA